MVIKPRLCPICGIDIKGGDEVVVIDIGTHKNHFRYRKRALTETHIDCFELYFGFNPRERR